VIRHPAGSDNGSYDVVVSDAGGCTTSESVVFRYCPGDLDCSGVITFNDLFGFLNAWFANDPAADFDANQTLSISDIYSYIGAWFSSS
jgi:hypothetical protein